MSDPFEIETDKLFHRRTDFDASEMAEAICLTQKELPVILIAESKRSPGRYEVRANLMAFLVAHTLGHPKVKVQLCQR